MLYCKKNIQRLSFRKHGQAARNGLSQVAAPADLYAPYPLHVAGRGEDPKLVAGRANEKTQADDKALLVD